MLWYNYVLKQNKCENLVLTLVRTVLRLFFAWNGIIWIWQKTLLSSVLRFCERLYAWVNVSLSGSWVLLVTVRSSVVKWVFHLTVHSNYDFWLFSFSQVFHNPTMLSEIIKFKQNVRLQYSVLSLIFPWSIRILLFI